LGSAVLVGLRDSGEGEDGGVGVATGVAGSAVVVTGGTGVGSGGLAVHAARTKSAASTISRIGALIRGIFAILSPAPFLRTGMSHTAIGPWLVSGSIV
jgi:hypothetical protein